MPIVGDGGGLAGQPLGAEICDGSEDAPGEGQVAVGALGDPEVRHLVAAPGADEDVAWLDVAMDAGVVGDGEGLEHFGEDCS